MGVEHSGSKKGIAIVAIIGIAAIAIFAAFFVSSFEPQTSSPTRFGDPPPMIELIHEGEHFEGQLISASFGVEETPQLSDAQQDLTLVTGDVIDLQQRSTIQFAIHSEGQLPDEPQSLSVNAFTVAGNPVGVLEIQREGAPYVFMVDLPQGIYILVTTVNWSADPIGGLSGYVVYGYRVNIT